MGQNDCGTLNSINSINFINLLIAVVLIFIISKVKSQNSKPQLKSKNLHLLSLNLISTFDFHHPKSQNINLILQLKVKKILNFKL